MARWRLVQRPASSDSVVGKYGALKKPGNRLMRETHSLRKKSWSFFKVDLGSVDEVHSNESSGYSVPLLLSPTSAPRALPTLILSPMQSTGSVQPLSSFI